MQNNSKETTTQKSKYKWTRFPDHYIDSRILSGLNLQSPDDYPPRTLGNPRLLPYAVCPAGQFIMNFWIYKLNVLTWQELLLLCMIFYLCSYSDISPVRIFRNVVEITIKMKIIVQKPLMIKISKCLSVCLISVQWTSFVSSRGKWRCRFASYWNENHKRKQVRLFTIFLYPFYILLVHGTRLCIF